MIELLKYLIKGLWFIVRLPVILVCYAFLLVFGLIQHLVLEIKSVILFFYGKDLDKNDQKMVKLAEYRKRALDMLNPFKENGGEIDE